MSKLLMAPPRSGKTLAAVVNARCTLRDTIVNLMYARVDARYIRDNQFRLSPTRSALSSTGSPLIAGPIISYCMQHEDLPVTNVSIALFRLLLSLPFYLKEEANAVFLQNSAWFAKTAMLTDRDLELQGFGLDHDWNYVSLDDYSTVSALRYACMWWSDRKTGQWLLDTMIVVASGNQMVEDIVEQQVDLAPRFTFFEAASYPLQAVQVCTQEVFRNPQPLNLQAAGVVSTVGFSANFDAYLELDVADLSTSSVTSFDPVVPDLVKNLVSVTETRLADIRSHIRLTPCTVGMWAFNVQKGWLDSAIGLPLSPPALATSKVGAMEKGLSPNFLLALGRSQISGVWLCYPPRGSSDPLFTGELDLSGYVDGIVLGRSDYLDKGVSEYQDDLAEELESRNQRVFVELAETSRFDSGNRSLCKSAVSLDFVIGGSAYCERRTKLSYQDFSNPAMAKLDVRALKYAAHVFRSVKDCLTKTIDLEVKNTQDYMAFSPKRNQMSGFRTVEIATTIGG